MNCQTCGKEYSVNCDYRQGRCPHHTPMIDLYKARFLNLINSIKGASWLQKNKNKN
jgi:hypothetical protein